MLPNVLYEGTARRFLESIKKAYYFGAGNMFIYHKILRLLKCRDAP